MSQVPEGGGPISALSLCEVWDLTMPPRPPHSRLYALPPRGLGTPEVESLTSYVARLADAHCVSLSTLALYEVLPLQERPYLSSPANHALSSFWKETARALNGTGVLAQDWVQILEALTCRADLRGLTMLPWAPVLTSQGLLRATRAWCPACLAEWQTTGQVVYEPLLWNLTVVTSCLRHQCRLCQQCPRPECQKTLPLLTAHTRPGYCSQCAQWLGLPASQNEALSPQPLSPDEWAWQSWAVKTVGELLASAPQLTVTPHQENIPALITAYLAREAAGRLQGLAQELHLARRTVRSWQQGVQIPQLASLLRLCYCCQLSPVHLLTAEAGTLRFSEMRTRALPAFSLPARKTRRPFATDQIRQALETVLACEEQPPPAMRTVAKRLDYSPRELREHFPDLCRAISTRYQQDRKVRGEQKRAQLKEEVRQAMLKLHAQGEYPRLYRVQALLSQPGFMLNPLARQHWRTLLQELGWIT